MEQASRGKAALNESKYDVAIKEFTAALKVSPTSPDYLTQRSTAYHRSKDYTSALTDAEDAVVNAQKRAKRELIVEAQFRRGCALYSLERYGDAEFVFNVVKRMDEKHKMVAMWVHKTKMVLQKLDEGDEKKKCTVKETPEVSSESSGSKREDSKASVNGASNGTTSQSQHPGSSATPTQPQQTPPDKIRHEWYQNNDNVYFTLLAKGVPKDKAQIDIQERSLSISFPLTTGSSYDFTLDPLFANVKPDKCIPKVMATKVEVILAKATPGQKWGALEAKVEPASATSISAREGAAEGKDTAAKRAVFADTKPTGPAYPTSAKSGPKDWDKIARGEQKKASKDGEGEEEAPLNGDDDDDDAGGDEANKFFKKTFQGQFARGAEGDDEVVYREQWDGAEHELGGGEQRQGGDGATGWDGGEDLVVPGHLSE